MKSARRMIVCALGILMVTGSSALMKNVVFTGYAAQTRSLLVSGGQTNLGAGLSYKNSWLEFLAERRKIGPNFSPEVGFLGPTD